MSYVKSGGGVIKAMGRSNGVITLRPRCGVKVRLPARRNRSKEAFTSVGSVHTLDIHILPDRFAPRQKKRFPTFFPRLTRTGEEKKMETIAVTTIIYILLVFVVHWHCSFASNTCMKCNYDSQSFPAATVVALLTCTQPRWHATDQLFQATVCLVRLLLAVALQ